MKKIINGKKYDTETAKWIGDYQYLNPTDFGYFQEDLYRKKTGEFFLFGQGGAMSKYSRVIGSNEYGFGEKIIPLTEKEARYWTEKYCSTEVYEELFGTVEE